MKSKVKQGDGELGTKEEFPQELTAAFEGSGEDRFLNAYAVSAADHFCDRDSGPRLGAVYKLVRVEKMKLEITRKVVKAK